MLSGNVNPYELHPFLKVLYNYKAVIPPCTDKKTYSHSDSYFAHDTECYTKWFHCQNYSTYTFFIDNIGHENAEVFIQLSPDKATVFNESPVFNIGPLSKKVIVPHEYSFYCRLAFKTTCTQHGTQLKIWFQAQS
jgi:hypothetical protein